MSWQQFKYIFNPEVENAMRYSIEEALRRHAADAHPQDVAHDAVQTFKRKMEAHTK